MVSTRLCSAATLLFGSYALLWAPTFITCHSLATCVDYRPSGSLHASPADSNCYARPRGFKKVLLQAKNPSVVCLFYRPGNGGHAEGEPAAYGNVCDSIASFEKGGYACDQEVQRRTVPFDAGYSSAAPSAAYKKGRDVCLEWPALSHCYGFKSAKYPNGAPYSPGKVYVHAVLAKADADPSQAELLNGKSWEMPFDDCSPDDNAEKGWEAHPYFADFKGYGRGRPARGCFRIDPNMTTGLWIFQWMYEQNENEWYSTCWDAVVSDSGDSYTAPPPGLRSPNPRTIPSAGLGSTSAWKAAPLQQVSSSPPACPPNTSGPVCNQQGSNASSDGVTTGLGRSGAGVGSTNGGASAVPGYEVLPGQELKGKFDYPCRNTVPVEYDHSSSECAHDGSPPGLAQKCDSDSKCQAFVWYPNGTPDGGRNVPSAWFKGGPAPVDVHATDPNPNAVVYIKQGGSGR